MDDTSAAGRGSRRFSVSGTHFLHPLRAPANPQDMPGAWQRDYERWSELTLSRLDPVLMELVPSLARFVPPTAVVDKRVSRPSLKRSLLQLLRKRHTDALIITGAETDVCVLAAVLGAVDFGYRVVLVTDAICSSSDETHDTLLTLITSASLSR